MSADTPTDLRAVLADDEQPARDELAYLLGQIGGIALVGQAGDGVEALEAITRLQPDLVFLDVQMPGLTGFEVARRVLERGAVGENGEPRRTAHIVFVTAFDQYAIEAFEVNAVDYLLKPFGAERLGVALERIRMALGNPPPVSALDRATEALEPGPIRRLFVRVGGGVLPVAVERIDWFEARGDYVAAHAGGSRHLLSLTLNQLETRLDPVRFLRIHRTHIVNLDRVVAFRSKGKGKLVAELATGDRLAVSRQRAQELRQRLT